jgi:hypothetical protein
MTAGQVRAESSILELFWSHFRSRLPAAIVPPLGLGKIGFGGKSYAKRNERELKVIEEVVKECKMEAMLY